MKETGWKRALFTSGVNHFFVEGKVICNTKAMFGTSNNKEEDYRKEPRGLICRTCESKIKAFVKKLNEELEGCWTDNQTFTKCKKCLYKQECHKKG